MTEGNRCCDGVGRDEDISTSGDEAYGLFSQDSSEVLGSTCQQAQLKVL